MPVKGQMLIKMPLFCQNVAAYLSPERAGGGSSDCPFSCVLMGWCYEGCSSEFSRGTEPIGYTYIAKGI